MNLATLEPVPTLRRRLQTELAHSFIADRPTRVARAPGQLDVMGGIADYMGSLVLAMPLGAAAAVALQERDDRQVQVMSFNLLDDHKPFQFQMPLDGLTASLPELRRELEVPGREWAGYAVGPIAVLHDEGLTDLKTIERGFNLAILSTVPDDGVGASAALEVAVMNALVDHLGLEALRTDPVRLATLCQRAENEVVGTPCGVVDPMASHLGEAGRLLKMVCQPHDVQGHVDLPSGFRVVGIDTNVRHSVGGGAYGRTRTAAFMGHRLILEEIRQLAKAANKSMRTDPTGGYLANLDPDDYKRLFRPKLPEAMTGKAFLDAFDEHGDAATTVDPKATYQIQAACDHHVLENRRVHRFADFLAVGDEKAMRSAGHLMYASHKSYTDNARLGAPEADVVVDLVKTAESDGLYGARITGGGAGGTVAVLLRDDAKATAALDRLVADYAARTQVTPQLLDSSSAGAATTKSNVLP